MTTTSTIGDTVTVDNQAGRVVGLIDSDATAWPRQRETVVVRVADTSEWLEVPTSNVRPIGELSTQGNPG